MERFDAMVTDIIVIIQILEMRIKDDLPRSSFFFKSVNLIALPSELEQDRWVHETVHKHLGLCNPKEPRSFKARVLS